MDTTTDPYDQRLKYAKLTPKARKVLEGLLKSLE